MIDVTKIPESEVKFLARTLIDCARKFYEDPKNVAAFKKWQQERKQKLA